MEPEEITITITIPATVETEVQEVGFTLDLSAIAKHTDVMVEALLAGFTKTLSDATSGAKAAEDKAGKEGKSFDRAAWVLEAMTKRAETWIGGAWGGRSTALTAFDRVAQQMVRDALRKQVKGWAKLSSNERDDMIDLTIADKMATPEKAERFRTLVEEEITHRKMEAARAERRRKAMEV